ncbi:hypothetical protein ACPWSR_03210 [Alloiococcus sp. CFN-8]|uniref:spermine/spermidine synthase domain-containing protein n=1 Tax=Alloiococcus sp. CFN-8 TaxID=3416081 RepID=UPI003CE74E9E
MNIKLNKEDIKKLMSLSNIRITNEDIISMYAEYIINHSKHITKELIEDFNGDGYFREEEAYYYLFLAACGFDIEKYENHREIARRYIRPSIKKLDTAKYLNNPYYKNIKIPNKKVGTWELKEETFQPYEAFLYDDVYVDESFREIPRLGFFSESFSFPAVLENNNEWMTITPSELESSQEAIDKAFGKVITYGLGLGYYAYMVSEKENVESITVIERDKAVIDLFETYILPQFSHKEKVKIINCDAFDYDTTKEHYDFAFVDIWRDAGDGFELYLKMKAIENPSIQYSYWIEESLLTVLRKHVLLALIQELDAKKTVLEPPLKGDAAYDEYLKVQRAVKENLKNITITSYNDITYYLSNPFLKKLAKNLLR